MKSNVKKFLSTVCILTSFSVIFAPGLVKDSSRNEEYSADFSSAAVAPAPVCDPVAVLMPLLRKKNHQEFYDKVIELMNKNLISKSVAVLLIMVDQLTVAGEKRGDWIISDLEVEDMIRSGDARNVMAHIQDMYNEWLVTSRIVFYLENALDSRAIESFPCVKVYVNGEKSEDEVNVSLDQALRELNPSSTKSFN